ncbi:LysR substrate-binding domain-containing protein [Oleispirillum naphthae]|uniref:LysR substrate-binding domain-containing protein n=1 Tax=Oleispirillum naphthae TaxID=2838853 RepID=UPI00308236DE
MNVSAITVKQLRVFDAVARHGSLTRAALGLFVTKAAVSVALRELENQLGSPLFDRRNNRLILNACGAQLRPLADDVLQRLATIEGLFSGESVGGRLRIGASVTIGNHLLPRLLGGFLREVEMPRPEVIIANTAQLCRMIEGFDLDAAFVEGGTHGAALAVEPLWRDRLRVIAAPGHALADGRAHALAELGGGTWILREASSGTREQFMLRLEGALPGWTLGLEFNTNEAIVNAVAAGLGLGFLSELAIADALAAGRIAAVALAEEYGRSLDLVVAPGKYQSPLLARFLEFCRGWSPLGGAAAPRPARRDSVPPDLP